VKRWLLLGLLLAMGACAGARSPQEVRPAPAWTGEEPLSWFDCGKGSTLVMRRTPGDGGKPYLLRERLTHSLDAKAEVALGNGGGRHVFLRFWPWSKPKPLEKFLRRDRLEVEGESVLVEVFERITPLGGNCAPYCGRLVEEVWKRVDAPRAEGALRVRYDRVHSETPPGCGQPPESALREADARGFVDTRRVLGVREEAVLDGWIYPCLRVRAWNIEDVPIDSLECPGVLGGKARWEEVQRFSDGRLRRDRIRHSGHGRPGRRAFPRGDGRPRAALATTKRLITQEDKNDDAPKTPMISATWTTGCSWRTSMSKPACGYVRYAHDDITSE
jgi:hypothetical protein